MRKLNFILYIPTKVVFGSGVVNRVGHEASKLGITRALLVTTRGGSLRRFGYVNMVMNSLQSSGIETELFAEVFTNPTAELADVGADVCRSYRCDGVIGLGGGSAIDVAKSIAIIALQGGRAEEYLKGERKAEKALPIIAIPTTHGTGTEVNRFAVLTDIKTLAKVAIASSAIYPKTAILDPELTKTLPPKLSAATTIDAFTHALESYIGLGATAVVDLFAEEAIREILQYAPKLLNNLSNVEIRSHLLYASMCAGIAISHGRTGVMHALEHAVSAFHPEVHHGIGLAALMLSWAKYIAPRVKEKFINIARLAKVPIEKLTIDEALQKTIALLEDLLKKLDLRIRLRDLGVEEGELRDLAENAMRNLPVLINNTPGNPSIEDLIEILRQAL